MEELAKEDKLLVCNNLEAPQNNNKMKVEPIPTDQETIIHKQSVDELDPTRSCRYCHPWRLIISGLNTVAKANWLLCKEFHVRTTVCYNDLQTTSLKSPKVYMKQCYTECLDC